MIEAMRPSWRNGKHAAQWEMTLRDYAAPLRRLPVDKITTDDVLSVLKPLWNDKPETASRLRGRIERVLDAAKAQGLRSGENPARWRGHLDQLLPKRQRLTRGHHAAMDYAEVPAFMSDLQARQATAALALEFAILTAARSGEVLGAQWEEFDLDRAIWTIPATRMKAGREHRVPLSRRALKIVKAMHEARNGDFVFPGQKPGRPAVRNGARNGAPPHEDRKRDGARLPLHFPGLGSRVHQFHQRGLRGRTCPCDREQGRSGLPARRPVRQAAQADGSMGCILHVSQHRKNRDIRAASWGRLARPLTVVPDVAANKCNMRKKHFTPKEIEAVIADERGLLGLPARLGLLASTDGTSNLRQKILGNLGHAELVELARQGDNDADALLRGHALIGLRSLLIFQFDGTLPPVVKQCLL